MEHASLTQTLEPEAVEITVEAAWEEVEETEHERTREPSMLVMRCNCAT